MSERLNVVSVFTGAGGLDLGLEAAGFQTRLCIENDPLALSTLACNRSEWVIAQKNDAMDFARNPLTDLQRAGLSSGDVTLLAGGPPCQPFSKASYWAKLGARRMRDPRASRTIYAYLRIVRKLLPEVLLFENVPGFAYRGRDEGYETILRGLRSINRACGCAYQPQLIKINAADYGVPQLRERVFIVAHRAGRTLEVPPPTHGPRSLSGRPYFTAWDAIGDAEPSDVDLKPQGRWAALLPSIPEGNNYLWHTPGRGGLPLFGWRTKYWSFLLKLAKNQPSWTIPASPGPAVGPFHWNSRLLSVDELRRLQTFPRNYKVLGNRRAAQRQIGNAVPCALAEFIGIEIRRQLLLNPPLRQIVTLLPKRRRVAPKERRAASVAVQYLHLVGNHKPHPGTGRGPGAV